MALTSTSESSGAPPSLVAPLVAVLGLLLASAVTLPVLVGAGVFSGEENPPTAYGDAGDIPAELVGAILNAGRTCATLSPGLLAAQLQQESGFNPQARSPVGAQGIAQFLPGTWSAYGGDADGDGRADPYNPADAIPAAARYDCAVAAAVAHLPGDPRRLMLAAYNAGPGAVLTHGGVPPYAETQTYVERITVREPAMTSALTAAGSPAGQIAPAARTAIAFARAQLGEPYLWGANGPDAWDCSSLVQAAYAAAGITIPRVTYDQVADSGPTVPLDRSAWRAGDLLFAAADGTPDNPGHVGLYIGDGKVLHAPRKGDVVKIVTVDRYLTVTGVTRPWALAD